MSRRVVIHWGLSSLHGWGVYGLNLALAWAGDPALEAATDYEVIPQHLTLDPLQAHALAGFRARSAKLRAELLRQKPEVLTLNAVLLAALGNDLQPQPGPHGGKLLGRPSLGTVFFEREALGPKAREALAPHAAIIAGSSWNAGVLRAHGAPAVELVLQGIDPALFHPAPRRGLFPGRFVVFSGGKLGRLDPTSGAMKEYDIRPFTKLAVSAPYGIVVDPQDRIWFGDGGLGGALVRFDPAAETFKYFPQPRQGDNPGLDITRDGAIVYTTRSSNQATIGLFWPDVSRMKGYGAFR